VSITEFEQLCDGDIGRHSHNLNGATSIKVHGGARTFPISYSIIYSRLIHCSCCLRRFVITLISFSLHSYYHSMSTRFGTQLESSNIASKSCTSFPTTAFRHTGIAPGSSGTSNASIRCSRTTERK